MELSSMNTWIRPERPLVIAHRGYSLIAPENTLPAYQKAIEAGADMVEMDINLTKDGELVMIHDHFLERTTNGTGLVEEYSLEELKRLDAAYHFKPRIDPVPIPTTEETLRLIKEAGVFVCLEIKGGNTDRASVIAEKVVKLVEKYQLLEKANMCSYFPEAVKLAKRLVPDLVISRERLPDDTPFEIADALHQAQESSAPILLSDFTTLKPGEIDNLHKAGIAMWTWNPFEPSDIEAVISQHTDGVMGDNPKVARDLVDKLAQR